MKYQSSFHDQLHFFAHTTESYLESPLTFTFLWMILLKLKKINLTSKWRVSDFWASQGPIDFQKSRRSTDNTQTGNSHYDRWDKFVSYLWRIEIFHQTVPEYEAVFLKFAYETHIKINNYFKRDNLESHSVLRLCLTTHKARPEFKEPVYDRCYKTAVWREYSAGQITIQCSEGSPATWQHPRNDNSHDIRESMISSGSPVE
jgi:hypothetical protein